MGQPLMSERSKAMRVFSVKLRVKSRKIGAIGAEPHRDARDTTAANAYESVAVRVQAAECTGSHPPQLIARGAEVTGIHRQLQSGRHERTFATRDAGLRYIGAWAWKYATPAGARG